MNPELWPRVEELFHAALDLSPDARGAFLEKACGEDTGLRRHVELLISNDEHAGSILEKPILADVMPQPENQGSFLPNNAVNSASGGSTKPCLRRRPLGRVCPPAKRESTSARETSEGTESRDLASTLAVRGTLCWSPEGKWIVIGGDDGKGDGLFKIPVDGGEAVRIATGPAANPVWSPDEPIILYAGADVGGQSPLLAVRPD